MRERYVVGIFTGVWLSMLGIVIYNHFPINSIGPIAVSGIIILAVNFIFID